MSGQTSTWQPELKKLWSSKCNDKVNAIVVSSKGKVAVASSCNIFVFDGPPSFATRKELVGLQAPVTALAFSCKGTDIVSGLGNGFIYWWQVESGAPICSTNLPPVEGFNQPLCSIPEVACSKAGYIAAAGGRILGIFGSGGEALHGLHSHNEAPMAHVVWLDDSLLAASCGSEVCVWQVTPQACTECGMFGTNPASSILALAASPSAPYLAAACANGTVQVWDVKQRDFLDPILVISDGFEAPVQQLAWDTSGRVLAAAVGCEVLVWDMSTLCEGRANSYVCLGFDPSATVTQLAFQSNGSLLAAAADDGAVLMYDASTFGRGGVVSDVIGHVAAARLGPPEGGNAVTALAWHSSGSLLLGGGSGELVALQPLRALLGRGSLDGMLPRTGSRPELPVALAAPAPVPPPMQATTPGHEPVQAAAPAQMSSQPAPLRRQRSQGTGAPPPVASPPVASPPGAPPPGAPPPGAPPPPPAAPQATANGNGSSSSHSSGRPPAGWGGEPLLSNGLGPHEPEASTPQMMGSGLRGRTRGGRGKAAAAPLLHPAQPHYRGEAAPPHNEQHGSNGALGSPMRAGAPPPAQHHHQQQHAPPPPGGPQHRAPLHRGPSGPPPLPPPDAQHSGGPGGGALPGGPVLPAGWNVVPAMAPMWRPMQPVQQMQYIPYGAQVMAAPPMGAVGHMAGPQVAGMPPGMTPYLSPGAGQQIGPLMGHVLPAGRGMVAVPPGGGGARPLMRQGSGAPRGGRGGGGHDAPGGGEWDGGGRGGGGSRDDGGGGGGGGGLARSISNSSALSANPRSGGGSSGPPHSPLQRMLSVPAVPSSPGGMIAAGMRPGAPGGTMTMPYVMIPPQGVAPQPWAMTAYPQQWPAAPYGAAGYYYHPAAGAAAAAAAYAQPMHGGLPMAPGGGMPDVGRGGVGAPVMIHHPQGIMQLLPQGSASSFNDRPEAGSSGGGGGGPRGASDGDGGSNSGGGGGCDGASDDMHGVGSGGMGGRPDKPLMTLYVGNLAPSVQESVLYQQFQCYGALANVQVIRDRVTNQTRGFGFVTYQHPGSAQIAMQHLNGAALMGPFEGRAIRVSPSNRR